MHTANICVGNTTKCCIFEIPQKVVFFEIFLNWFKVLYMSFDKFLLAVESRDLSQADKSIIRVSPFQS